MSSRQRIIAALGLIMSVMLGLTACDGAYSDEAGRPSGVVTIYSTTDAAVFEPVIADFRALNPAVELNYVEMDAMPLFERFLREEKAGKPVADLILSSAIDLQVKLVNDGYAQPHVSRAAQNLPEEARWRNEIFGLTFEPVVFVANTKLLPNDETPQSRFELLRSLRQRPDFWRGRVGTYDITASSVGYLLAAQDARQSSEFGALIGAFGALDTHTYANMSALIDDIGAGRVALGYNVLASYARGRISEGAPMRIVYPEDYTLAVVRAAFISRDAPNPVGAHAFLDYLMSARGQRILATRSELSAASLVTPDANGPSGLGDRVVGPLRPIPIGPGLLTFLDRMKRERFLANWRAAFGHDSADMDSAADAAPQAGASSNR